MQPVRLSLLLVFIFDDRAGLHVRERKGGGADFNAAKLFNYFVKNFPVKFHDAAVGVDRPSTDSDDLPAIPGTSRRVVLIGIAREIRDLDIGMVLARSRKNFHAEIFLVGIAFLVEILRADYILAVEDHGVRAGRFRVVLES